MRSSDYSARTPEDYLAKLDPTVLDSLSATQLEAFKQVLTEALPKPSPKLVDLRFVVDLIVDRFYVVLFIGQDRRQKPRRYMPTRVARIGNAVTIVVLLLSANLTISAAMVLALYLLKSAIGIDLLPGSLSDFLKQALGRD